MDDKVKMARTADNMDMFTHLVRSFEAADMPYCILAGYDDYPDRIDSDIDFMLPESWSARLPEIVAGVGGNAGRNSCRPWPMKPRPPTMCWRA